LSHWFKLCIRLLQPGDGHGADPQGGLDGARASGLKALSRAALNNDSTGDGGAGLSMRRARPAWATSNAVIGSALAVAVAIAFFTTWFMLSPGVETASRSLLRIMVVANGAILIGLAALVGYRLWRVWSDRRNHIAGAQTQLQLALMFALVAVVPSLFAFLFALTILRSSMNDVFSARIENYQNIARRFANDYFNLEASIDYLSLQQIENDLLKGEVFDFTPATSPMAVRAQLGRQAFLRGLSAIYLLDKERNVISRVEPVEAPINFPSAQVFDGIEKAIAEGKPPSFHDLSDEAKIDYFRGTLKSRAFGGSYLVIYRPVQAPIGSGLLSIRSMRDDWDEAKIGRARIERVFLAGYLVLAFIIVLSAVWLALWAATRMVRPVGRLMRMANRVSSGDLGARVEVYKDDGELGALARSMNHMTAQLQTQRNDLIETNRQFDRRRRFTEAVLSGVSAGVVGVAADGRVTIANRFAADILRLEAGRQTGARIEEILPELQGLLAEAAAEGEAAEQVEIERAGRKRTLNVRIVSDMVDGERSFVVTFDDITQLISAQRNAAWGDVARRIAHEIKNPLTPIQLSAERLRRKYIDEIKTQPEIFDKCTETIIRHVNDIGRMVDEFSSFARMPKPVMTREDLRELVKAAVFPQKVALADIDFAVEAPAEQRLADCDGRLIVQALSNLLKNAGESIGARLSADGGDRMRGKIVVRVRDLGDFTSIDVIDNGVGLPKAERHRLTEPYMTTRAKGTGLGLAIVRKVVEEHGGYMEFDDDNSLGPTGARVSIALPARTETDLAPRAKAAAE
jgi:two-component system nitrogen regulation sensor histidine kinase NtrY